ncbi:MAG: amidohydrolase [Oscillospiraceae bacterium]|nr:amidohydrolase [Oscillospiraceae bacterium]
MAPTKKQLKEMAIQAIERNRDKIIAYGDSIFDEPELGYKEYKTAKKTKKVFEELGIPYRDKVALTGVTGTLKGGSSKATIALMGELDAVITRAHTAADPETGAAHTCGHNCMMAGLIGAAYGLVGTGVMKYLDGNVELMAVPAEEFVELEYRRTLIKEGKISCYNGKQELVLIGELDHIDMVVMQHNGAGTGDGILACAGYTTIGARGKIIQYLGKAAHAGAAPHLGINALNAAKIGLMAVDAQRETFQDKDSIRVHPVITKGGDLVNVVPDDVRIETYVRGNNLEAIVDAEKKVDRAFMAGAAAVGAECIIDTLPGSLPFLPYDVFMNVFHANLVELLGEDKVVNLGAPLKGGTDASDLSYIMPTIHAGFAGVEGALHSKEFEIVDRDLAYLAVAKVYVMTVIDLLYDGAAVAQEVKAKFKPVWTKKEYLKEWVNIEI